MTSCRTARTANDNTAAHQVMAAARAELQAAGLPCDDGTVAHLLAWRLIYADRAFCPGFVRMDPQREAAVPRVRPAPIGVEVDTGGRDPAGRG